MTLSEHNIFTRQMEYGHYLIYLPLSKYARILTQEQVNNLTDSVEKSEQAEDPAVTEVLANVKPTQQSNVYITEHSVTGIRNMMILPNNVCNFKCTYCYSAEGRSGKTIDSDKLKSALCYFLDSNRVSGERLTISILGGGEPLLSWDLVKDSLDLAYSLAEKRGHKLPVSIVTNGSILTDEIVDYLRSHEISLSVSFDILPEIQNMQRGHYETVVENINRFTNAGIDLAFNTVITCENVGRMDEMLHTIAANTPKVKKVSFKSLISNNYFKDADERRKYYRDFVDNFFKALDLAKQLGIWLTSPYFNNALCLSDRFCPGKFVVTSDGDISICHCVGSRKDRLYNDFIFGHITADGNVAIDEEKLEKILSHDHNRNERCKDCIAHWHCAGGCYADNSTIGDNEESQNAYCESMRYFIERYICKYILK